MFSGVHDMICQLPQDTRPCSSAAARRSRADRSSASRSPAPSSAIRALVVLDEPNSNLDAAGEQALTETLQRAKQRASPQWSITQRPALLNSVDKVLILRAGRAEAFGSPSDVLHRLVRSPGADRRKQAGAAATNRIHGAGR